MMVDPAGIAALPFVGCMDTWCAQAYVIVAPNQTIIEDTRREAQGERIDDSEDHCR